MAKPTFDQEFWEQLWSKTLREHGDKVARRPPNAHLMAEQAAVLALSTACRHPAIALGILAANFPDQRFGALILLYVIVIAVPYVRWQRRQAATAAPV